MTQDSNPVRTLSLSPDGLERLKKREGCRLRAYDSKDGHWSIGYGHWAGIKAGEVWTQAQADLQLAHDLAPVEALIKDTVTVPLSQREYDTLVSFIYNIGVAAWGRSRLLRDINKGQYAEVPALLMQWTNVAGVFNRGLFNRRKSEASQFTGSQ